MRISDGVKKYQEDTKNRIFENIMATAAASEETQGYSSLADKRDHSSDDTIGATNDKAVVKRDWTGLIAIAACAVLAVGIGTVTIKGNSPRPEINSETAAAETEISDGAVTQAVTAQARDSESYYEDGMTFGELLEQSDEVIELRVKDRQLVKVPNESGVRSGKDDYYVEYTAAYEYDSEKSGAILKSSGEAAEKTTENKYLQHLGEIESENLSDLSLAYENEIVLAFVKKGVTDEGLKIDSSKSFTTDDSIYRFDIANHKYVNITSPGKYEDEVNQYVLDTLKGMNTSAVYRWTAYHRLSIVTVEEKSDSVPSGQIIDLEWDEDRQAYLLTVSA